MENNKVYLRIETPFSVKNPITMRMALLVGLMPLVMIAVSVMLFLTPMANPNVPYYFAGLAVVWFVMGLIPVSLMIFNGYARAEDGDLIVNQLGFGEKRYPRGTARKALKEGGRLVIYGDGKPLASMPKSEAAENLVRSLYIPMEDGVRIR